MKRGVRRGALGALLAGLAAGPLAAAQSGGLLPVDQGPSWLEAWSPLGPRADLPRRLPQSDAAVASLLLPAPRVGLFWTAGNPAGLREELDDRRTDFAVQFGRESGSYRRPLDPGKRTLQQARGMAWAPLDRRFALLGRVLIDRQRFDPGTTADVVEPFPSSPFVTIDTSTTATRRTRARLEGVGSLRLGRWSLGLTLGYEALEHQTINAGFIRRTRYTLPGAVVGISRTVGSVRLGPYARWRNREETIQLVVRGAFGQVVQLEGLREVVPIDIPTGFFRRMEENVPSTGFSMAGPLGRARWALFAERQWLRERLTRQQTDNPRRDRWDADGWSAGGALQRSVGRRSLFTLEGRYTTLSGDGDLALDSLGVIFVSSERALVGRAEWRVNPDSVGWAAVLSTQVRYERRVRDNLTPALGSRVKSTTVGLGLEVGRAVTPDFFVTATAAYSGYTATSSFPAPNVLGAVYRAFVLPELDLAARDARPYLGALGFRWRVGPGTSLWAVAQGQRLSPSDAGPTGLGPRGSRSTVGGVFGVTLR